LSSRRISQKGNIAKYPAYVAQDYVSSDVTIVGEMCGRMSAPQFESPQCIRICARITRKYALITGIVHRYIIKGFELY
jgi:hypothetical protein